MTAEPPAATSCLSVAGLHVRYPNGAHAVRGVDLAVGGGETVALVGESGCGKTTIAHAILGLLPPRAHLHGSIVLRRHAGERSEAAPDVELVGLGPRAWRAVRGRRIGYVGQNPFRACDPLRTVGHHVASAWIVHGEQRPPGAVGELLESLGITDAERRARLHPHQWSGGMLQRASIAAARALGPELIVADEPTSALDAELARSTLQALRDAAVSILLVTHDLSLAEEVADTIYVLYGGEVMEHRPVGEILRTPRHPYTVSLLGAVPRHRGRPPTPLPGGPPSPLHARSGCVFAPRCPAVHDACSSAPALVGGVACHL